MKLISSYKQLTYVVKLTRVKCSTINKLIYLLTFSMVQTLPRAADNYSTG
jgi:hypothetical protein